MNLFATSTGIIVQDQQSFSDGIRSLANSRAGMRWVRIEPLKGPIELGIVPDLYAAGTRRAASSNEIINRNAYERQALIEWVVIGARLFDGRGEETVRAIRSLAVQCAKGGVPLCLLDPIDADSRSPHGWPADVAGLRQPPRRLK